MLGIGFPEMVLIAGIALIVIGPEKFPEFAKLVVRTIRDLRGYVDELKNEVSKELKPIKKEVDQLSKIDPEKYIDSLTKEAPERPANPSLHEEDRKVMEEAGAYDEDPYGWEGAEPGGYDQPPANSAPEDTVGYGEQPEEGAPADSTVEQQDDASQEHSGEEETETREGEGETGKPAADSEFDLADNACNAQKDQEPDVWTGR